MLVLSHSLNVYEDHVPLFMFCGYATNQVVCHSAQPVRIHRFRFAICTLFFLRGGGRKSDFPSGSAAGTALCVQSVNLVEMAFCPAALDAYLSLLFSRFQISQTMSFLNLREHRTAIQSTA